MKKQLLLTLVVGFGFPLPPESNALSGSWGVRVPTDALRAAAHFAGPMTG
jgi:hypothetical protein